MSPLPSAGPFKSRRPLDDRYLGKSDEFDLAIRKFAVAYADQAERDHNALKGAVRSGAVDVILDR